MKAPFSALALESDRPFALLLRHDANQEPSVEFLRGDMYELDTLASIPSTAHNIDSQLLVLVPYRQVSERGFACVDDASPILLMRVRSVEQFSLESVIKMLPQAPIHCSRSRFDLDDVEYADRVRRIITEEIGRGEGSNFVLKRTFLATINNYSLPLALAAFRRLLMQEVGAYWTFLFHTGNRTFVGASPERHVTVRDGLATMNPISGTYRYPPAGPTLVGVMRFLSDEKERDELYMVVDEELKMMARFCPGGGKVVGPYLREMSRLAHTEYFIEGRTIDDPRKILQDTLLAPTVTGSPIENACRIIARHEPEGRGYYGGVIAMIRGSNDEAALDSAIVIRTADIDASGHMRIGVGATIVRHSDPLSEAAETRAKATALLHALGYQDGSETSEKSPTASSSRAMATLVER